MSKLFIGIDVSKNDYEVCFLNGEGERTRKTFTLRNNSDDSSKLVQAILADCKSFGLSKIFIGYESTSVYGFHLQYFLADSKELAPFHPTIICFNPKIIDAFKKTLGDLPKTDKMDAFAIAERLRFGRLPDSVPVDFRYLALQRLTRHRFHIIENIVREKSYYLSNLFLKCSGLCQSNVFSNNFGAAASFIVEEYSDWEDIANMPLENLSLFLTEKGRDQFEDVDQTAEKLRDAIRSSYRLSPNVDNSLNFVLRSCLGNIKALEAQKKAVDKAIQKEIACLKNEYICLTSVKGIGPVIAAGLISEIAGVHRFDNDNALAKFAGIYWNSYQSAGFTADETNLRKQGNKYLRYYFIQAADQLRKYLPEYAAFYSRKFKESKTHHHKRALVLTSRKVVRLVFALLRENKLYSPTGKGVDSETS